MSFFDHQAVALKERQCRVQCMRSAFIEAHGSSPAQTSALSRQMPNMRYVGRWEVDEKPALQRVLC
jgi:hypothetical protein